MLTLAPTKRNAKGTLIRKAGSRLQTYLALASAKIDTNALCVFD